MLLLRTSRPALLLGMTLAAAGNIEAGVLVKVAPGQSIQAAVDSASPGDTVLVAAGVYREVVRISPALTGLTLKGKGKVVLDGRDGGVGHGACLDIQADNVTVIGFTVRHPLGILGDPGDGVRVTANAVTLVRITALHCDEAGIMITGDDARVVKCLLDGNDDGLVILGNRARIERTVVRKDDNKGIVIAGDDAAVIACKLLVIEDGNGILITGDNALLQRNVIKDSDQPGIHVAGSGFMIRRNTVGSVAMVASCIRVTGAFSGTLEANKCRDSRGSGIRVDASGITLIKNKVEHVGAENDPGYFINGDSNFLVGNLARSCQADGFLINGGGNVLTGNRALLNLQDGIDVELGALNQLTGNVANGNQAEGIENNGVLTKVTLNKASGNRIDWADDGSVSEQSGNLFGTTGTPVIDD